MNPKLISDFEAELDTPEFIANPYPLLHRLRQEAPVYWSDVVGGWVLTGYDDIVASFKNTSDFSNEDRLGRTAMCLLPEKRASIDALEDDHAAKGWFHSDSSNPTRLRALVSKGFNPAAAEQMRPRIQELANDLLDAAQAKDRMDVVPDFAAALPVLVIAEILGVPASDRHLFKLWADALLDFRGVKKPSEADMCRTQSRLIEIRAYLVDMIEERRRHPREDLMSKFVAAESLDESLLEAELVNTLVRLFVAGYETTVSLIGNTIYLLLSNPDQLRLLQQHPEWLAPALEESLRCESPIARQPRLIKTDAEFGGQEFLKAQMVLQMLNAANRDPAYFPDPDKFDIQRKKNRHIAFGNGVDLRLGAVLARTEASVALAALLERLPGLRFSKELAEWDLGRRNSRVLKTLPVRF